MTPASKVTPESFCIEMARLYLFHKMYPNGNPNVGTAAERTAKMIADYGKPIRFSKLGADLFVEDVVITKPTKQVQKLFDAFTDCRWESVRFNPDIGSIGMVRVLDRMNSGGAGAYSSHGFSAGTFNVDEISNENPALADSGAGYMAFIPMVQELLEDVGGAKNGAWLRAHDVVRTLTDFMMSGTDLFGEIHELKDFDEYTFTHAINVALVASAMAKSMQVSDRIVDAILLGGLCHDLGKKSISPSVLNKPDRLSSDERAMMDRHPVEGAAMILKAPGVAPSLVPVIAFQHHMKPNGGGYPVLPVPFNPHPASMLVSVADTFDALRTVRPYQVAPASQSRSLSVLIELADTGIHHRLFISVLARLIGILTPGRNVQLSDGRNAVILSEGESDTLAPLVETDDMEIMDLSMPGTPKLTKVLD